MVRFFDVDYSFLDDFQIMISLFILANLPGEISSKSVAKIFWKQELVEELQDLGLHEKWVFTQKRGSLSGSDEDAMEHVERIRSENLYHHECSPSCQRKGLLPYFEYHM